jgi:hypothetical protein
MLRFFRNFDFIKCKLYNRTKIKVIKNICEIMINEGNEENCLLFEEYVNKISNTVTLGEVETYLKIYGDSPEPLQGNLKKCFLKIIFRKNL